MATQMAQVVGHVGATIEEKERQDAEERAMLGRLAFEMRQPPSYHRDPLGYDDHDDDDDADHDADEDDFGEWVNSRDNFLLSYGVKPWETEEADALCAALDWY